MPAGSSPLAELLPPASGKWEVVAGGESGASVFVDRGEQRFAKIVPADRRTELAAERDRSIWINRTAKTPDPDITPDYQISHLSELLPLVHSL